MEHGKKTAVDKLVDYDNVRDRGTATHEQGNVGVSQNALHHDFILNLGQEFVRDVGVENFLNCDRRAIQQALVDDRETTLAYLLSQF